MLTPDDFINEIRSLRYSVHRLIEINQELEEKNHQILGLSHHQEATPMHVAVNKDGNIKVNKWGDPKLEPDHPEWADLPMPSYRGHGSTSPLGMLEEISLLESEANYYRKRILDCRWSEMLSLTDQNILWDMYLFNTNRYALARKYGYSKSGLYKHIETVIKEAFIGEDLQRPEPKK